MNGFGDQKNSENKIKKIQIDEFKKQIINQAIQFSLEGNILQKQ